MSEHEHRYVKENTYSGGSVGRCGECGVTMSKHGGNPPKVDEELDTVVDEIFDFFDAGANTR